MSYSEENADSDSFILDDNPIVCSDNSVIRMLQSYARRAAQDAMAAASAIDGVSLRGVLGSTRGFGYLHFRVAKERAYIVRDVRQFVAAIRDNLPISYGKNLSFVHSLNVFSEDSRVLADFLLAYSEMLSSGYESKYLPPNMIKSGLFLTPLLMDRFAEHCLKAPRDTVTVDIEGKIFEARISTETPKIQITIARRLDSGYSVLMPPEQPPITIFKGSRRLYLLVGEVFYITSHEYNVGMRDFLEAIVNNPNRDLTIASEDMPAFCASLVGTLRQFTAFEEYDDISQFTPPPLKTAFYLDLDEQGQITGRMEFDYAGKVHRAFCPKHPSRSLNIRGEGQMEFLVRPFFTQVSSHGILSIMGGDDDKIFDLINNGLPLFSPHMALYASDSIIKMKTKRKASVSVGVRLNAGLLNISVQISSGEVDLEELRELLLSYRFARRYHRLKDGSFMDLQGKALGDLCNLMEGLGITEKELAAGKLALPEFRAFYLDSLLKENSSIDCSSNKVYRDLVKGVNGGKALEEGAFPIPEPLEGILRDYQKTGYYWMRTLAAHGLGGILADDMGLGKTLQVIALLRSGHTGEKGEASLVICPSSLVLNWEQELRHFAPELTVEVITGNTETRADVIHFEKNVDVMITSYDLLKRDIAHYIQRQIKYLIADEAQYLKNHNTQNAKSIKALKARHRFALTGTPIENTLAELWSIFDFLMPGYLHNYTRFRRDFEIPITRGQDAEKPLAILHKMVAPFMLRRMKKEVLKELPEKTETVLSVPLEGKQEKIYKHTATAITTKFAKFGWDAAQRQFEVLAAITQLRQLCCHPSMLFEDYDESSPKLTLCMELVENAISSGHRILIFSQFTTMLDILEKTLESRRIPSLILTGKTPSSTRLDLVNRFNDGDIPVFLISLKAGGTGLNLTGADMVIHFDPWWNLSAENQASDRAYRIGQEKSVQIYKLIAANTIEEKILAMQAQKADLADMIIDDTDNPLPKLSGAELEKLFYYDPNL